MPKESMLLDMSDPTVKRRLMSKIGTLTGLYDVSLQPRRRTRSTDQNSYYWAAVVQPFTEWLKEQYGDPHISKEQAHDLLKKTVLGTKELVSKATGEVIELFPDSHTLDVKDFSDYIEGCAKFLAEFAEIIVVPSGVFHDIQPKIGVK